MITFRFEILRDGVWSVRAGGSLDVAVETLIEQLPAYALRYEHRLVIDERIVATVLPPRGGRRKPKVTIL
jgi:hypothetical protein